MRLLSNNMNHVDSDLEEGEIPDDSPSSPMLNVKNNKKLPRRYAIRKSKDSHHKHKKNCKYSPYRGKKIDKLKNVPSKVKDGYKSSLTPFFQKSYKKSAQCKIHGSPSNSKKISPNHNIRSRSSFANERNSFENRKVFGLKSNAKRQSFEKKFYSEIVETINDYSFSEMLTKYKAIRSKNSDHFSSQASHSSLRNSEGLKNIETIDLSTEVVKNSCNSEPSSEKKEEESEDEEELRRIALATCAKRKINSNPPESNISASGDNTGSLPVGMSVYKNTPNVPTNSIAKDNYDVVDMEVEEDNQNLHENADCFIIDNKPSSNSQKVSVAVSKQKEKNNSDEEFEVDILRAELIEEMYRKKLANEEPICLDKAPEDSQKIEKSSPKSNQQILREKPAKVLESLKFNFEKSASEMVAKIAPKRLIITLDGESSSEESEQDEGNSVNAINTNPVASIEALISDIRQKSDSNDTNNSVAAKFAPKHLEYLSKSQQEEYNSLIKILAKKNKVPSSEERTEVKNKTIHSPMEDLKVLEEKLVGVRETLDKKKELMIGLSKEVNAKKFLYMKSKLTAQHLKEKYVAAERQRRVNLNAWSKSCKNFESAKKTVSDLQNKITELQDLCSKVGFSIQGKSYSLPPTETESEQP